MCGYRKTTRQTKVEDVMSRISWRAGPRRCTSPHRRLRGLSLSDLGQMRRPLRPLRLGARHPSCYVMADLGSNKKWFILINLGWSWIIMDFFMDFYGFWWIEAAQGAWMDWWLHHRFVGRFSRPRREPRASAAESVSSPQSSGAPWKWVARMAAWHPSGILTYHLEQPTPMNINGFLGVARGESWSKSDVWFWK